MSLKHVQSLQGLSLQGEGTLSITRSLPDEVPVAMVYDGSTLAVMMACPNDILDFAYGFSLSEGIITTLDQIARHEIVEQAQGVEVRFWLREDRSEALDERRRTLAGPVGCGLCGIESLEQALRPLPVIQDMSLRLNRHEVASATEALSGSQPLHRLTGAMHAAAFLAPDQGIVLAREDVGRHNALDKVLGAMARQSFDARGGALVLTSRVSVELVQKCAIAGCSVLIAVSAPTAHALKLAQDCGITLVAFARGGGFDVYSHPHRIELEAPHVP